MYILYTYNNIDELRKIQTEQDVFPFIFQETKAILEENPAVCIDITALVYSLEVSKQNILSAYHNLADMTEETTVIINKEIASSGLSLLSSFFVDEQPYFDKPFFEEDDVFKDYIKRSRRTLYYYNHISDLDSIIKYTTENKIPLATFSQSNGDVRKQFERINKLQSLAIVDITSVSYALEDNKSLIYLVEQFLELFSNISIIVLSTRVSSMLSYFPLFFDSQEEVSKLLPELSLSNNQEIEKPTVSKVTELDEYSFSSFWEKFSYYLVGHQNFKSRLQIELKNFILLNKVKDQKVYSVFLYGTSGIGKTEVARVLAKSLREHCYLPKINFQNYSSQDSLNSLIGSPAGYVGCEHGELSDKVGKSNVGVILCDEFEKTTKPVFSFFLELLEEGKFTDSMAREYDMDGYIIIFTSNIVSEEEYKRIIPPELQTRFDLVCEFEQPTLSDKRVFVELLLREAKSKYSEYIISNSISDQDLDSVVEFYYENVDSLRDIKRMFNKRIMKLFSEKRKDSPMSN